MQLQLLSVFLALFPLCVTRVTPTPVDQTILGSDKDTLKKIRKILQKASIIPSIIDDFTPTCFLTPSYDNVLVEYGTHFNTSATKSAPKISISCPSSPKKDLTLILTDPDAPSRDNPKWGEMCHWIATLSAEGKLEDVVEYKAPGPPSKTGYHRYVFLLLEGDNSDLKEPDDRQHWGFGKKGHGVRDWAKQEGLEVVGGNFFLEQDKKQ